jgi:uncharacterized protein (TIGR02646 family)
MFNIIRPQPGPDCSKDYHREEVIRSLQKMFYGKCYLCEDEVSDPVVEHFIPHEGDRKLEYNWNNLYYSCHRCNNIKGTEKNLLDCCDLSTDVSKAIKCLCPSIPEHNVIVEAQNTSLETQNTAKLLNKCYNEDNTGIRAISREALHEKLFNHYFDFIRYRRVIKNKDSASKEKDNAKKHLENMMDVSYPFSIFWRWHVSGDAFLSEQLAVAGDN